MQFLFDFTYVISVSAFSFLRSGLMHCLEIISPKNRINVHLKWIYSILGSTFCILVALFIVCCHGLCHCYYTLQWKYHLQCQMHLVAPWIALNYFFFGTCCLLGLLQMVVPCICISQTNITTLWNMMISHLTSGYDI